MGHRETTTPSISTSGLPNCRTTCILSRSMHNIIEMPQCYLKQDARPPTQADLAVTKAIDNQDGLVQSAPDGAETEAIHIRRGGGGTL